MPIECILLAELEQRDLKKTRSRCVLDDAIIPSLNSVFECVKCVECVGFECVMCVMGKQNMCGDEFVG